MAYDAPDKDQALTPGVPRALGGMLGKIEPVTLPVDSYFPDHRAFVHADLLAQAHADVERAEKDLRKARDENAAAELSTAGLGVKAGFDKLRAAADRIGQLALLILDIRLPDGDAFDFLPEMSSRRIATPVLLLSASCEDFIVHRVL